VLSLSLSEKDLLTHGDAHLSNYAYKMLASPHNSTMNQATGFRFIMSAAALRISIVGVFHFNKMVSFFSAHSVFHTRYYGGDVGASTY
jgi:hypothetical protein